MMRSLFVLSSVTVSMLLPAAMYGFQASKADAKPKVIEAKKITDNFYMLTGGGGNTGMFITQNNGVMIIDTKLPGWGSVLVEKNQVYQ
jgi:hypothetical protein